MMKDTKVINEVKLRMDSMGIENLKEIIAYANSLIIKCKNQRKKELWGNVIAAIDKYEAEIGLIEVICRNCGDSGSFDDARKDEPGCLSIS